MDTWGGALSAQTRVSIVANHARHDANVLRRASSMEALPCEFGPVDGDQLLPAGLPARRRTGAAGSA